MKRLKTITNAPSLANKVAWLLAVVLVGALADAEAAPAGGTAPWAEGDRSVHDPSRIVRCEGRYWLFATGMGISSRHSADTVTWEPGPRVFTNAPAWTAEAVPGFRGHFWAPDVIHLNGRYLLYYSVSTWGSQVSAIGLATNATLNPADPAFGWVDCGVVVQSRRGDDFNAIDPAVMLASDGRLWLVFGSFWGGIKLVELDPATGKRLDTNAPPVGLAWKNEIEAAAMHQRDGYYYLFLNWGLCCRGTNSTYNIRVRRSRLPTGPYLDREGKDLLRGGGTLVLDSQGPRIGPGHAGFFTREGQEYMSYHYYNGDRRGAKTLGIARLTWTAEGWPRVEFGGPPR